MCLIDLALREAKRLGKLNHGFKLELSLSILALNMHVHSRFFPGEEVKTKPAFAEYCRTHDQNDTRTRRRWEKAHNVLF